MERREGDGRRGKWEEEGRRPGRNSTYLANFQPPVCGGAGGVILDDEGGRQVWRVCGVAANYPGRRNPVYFPFQ